MSTKTPIAAKVNVTQSTYELLKEALLTCRFRPGERLNIRELSLRLGINTTGLREALSRLTTDGFVHPRVIGKWWSCLGGYATRCIPLVAAHELRGKF
ncbi:GntR family transcriptional regulator [Pseudomonas monteilii]|uniref:GntR family transcriptional regulator n=1 Tax=Pseudomonas monteilii TaxID=76759 RepID=UPI003D0783DA